MLDGGQEARPAFIVPVQIPAGRAGEARRSIKGRGDRRPTSRLASERPKRSAHTPQSEEPIPLPAG